MDQKGGKAWLNFFVQDLKERKSRYVTVLAAMMFSKIPASLKDTFEINSLAQRNYRKLPFPGRLTLFRASKQEEGIPSDNGWGSIFLGGIDVHEIPGDHWEVLSEPGIDVLANSISDCLRRLEEPIA
jgi:thioesterase domain-containing protein